MRNTLKLPSAPDYHDLTIGPFKEDFHDSAMHRQFREPTCSFLIITIILIVSSIPIILFDYHNLTVKPFKDNYGCNNQDLYCRVPKSMSCLVNCFQVVAFCGDDNMTH